MFSLCVFIYQRQEFNPNTQEKTQIITAHTMLHGEKYKAHHEVPFIHEITEAECLAILQKLSRDLLLQMYGREVEVISTISDPLLDESMGLDFGCIWLMHDCANWLVESEYPHAILTLKP